MTISRQSAAATRRSMTARWLKSTPVHVPNGFYVLQLSATDIAGRQSITHFEVEVQTSTKPAAVQASDYRS